MEAAEKASRSDGALVVLVLGPEGVAKRLGEWMEAKSCELFNEAFPKVFVVDYGLLNQALNELGLEQDFSCLEFFDQCRDEDEADGAVFSVFVGPKYGEAVISGRVREFLRQFAARNPCSKIAEAFDLMRRAGLKAEQDFTCCQSCGRAAMEGDYNGEKGWCFYHGQATDDLAASGTAFLNFDYFLDDPNPPEGDAEAIGNIVVDCLEQAGVQHRWTGDACEAIQIWAEVPGKLEPSLN